MRKKNFKGRCEKRKLSKCEGVCKTYDALQYAYADMLEADNDIVEIRCNVQLEGMDYTSDFLCVKANGEYMVSADQTERHRFTILYLSQIRYRCKKAKSICLCILKRFVTNTDNAMDVSWVFSNLVVIQLMP